MKQTLNFIAKQIFGERYFDLMYWYLFFRATPTASSKLPSILILNHFFNQDIEALKRANTQFSFVIFQASILRFLATQLFPPSADTYEGFNSAAMEPIRKQYRKILRRFVEKLITKYHIKAVVAPSDNFFYVRDLIPVLHEFGIPYFVVDKEGTICPAYFVHFAQYIKDNSPLLADHILVWSDRQKEFWKRADVEEKRISVVGQPRSDFWKQPDRWGLREELHIPALQPKQKLIVFFTYDPWAYTPVYMVERGEMHWESLRTATHETIYDFARHHPDCFVVIKAHPQQPDVEKLRHEISALQMNNLALLAGATLSNLLIVHADALVGFQTTALIEAMVTDKPIIYTFWGEAKDRWSADLIPFHETAGVTTVTSPEALSQALDRASHGQPITAEQRQARDSFVHEYFTDVDGRSSQRTLDRIAELLSDWQKTH